MSTLRNTVQLIGNLGKNPEIKTANNGNKYAMFSIATTENYTNKAGEKVKETTWHNITLWGAQADIAEKYLSTGSQVGIKARLVNNEYTDKDGTKKSRYELKVSDIMLLGGGNKTTNTEPATKQLVTADGDDGLPF
jgi:single-strand DNA-binding protein